MTASISRRMLAGLASLTFLLAACGGGSDSSAVSATPGAGNPGNGNPVGGGPVSGGSDGSVPPATGGSTTPLSFAHAPALPAAPSALPVVAARNICENVAIGNRRIENLRVPDGATCVLDAGTVIDGNIELGTGSSLFARSLRLDGNIQGQRARDVLVERSIIGGSVQLDIGGAVGVYESTIDGNIQLDGNAGGLYVLGNQLDGDVQLFGNRAGATVNENRLDGNIQVEDNRGALEISRNRANGNLQCKQNDPAPTGFGNIADSLEDQCRSLG